MKNAAAPPAVEATLAEPTGAMILAPKSLQEAMQASELFAKSALIPRTLQGKPADVLVVMLTGQELGIGPMTAFRGLFVVDGKPALYATMMLALVRRSGLAAYIREVEGNEQVAVWETKRRDTGEIFRGKFTIDEARKAGLLAKDNWSKYPAAMLAARAQSMCVRKAYSEVLLGLHTAEELGADAIELVETSADVYAPPPTEGPSAAARTAEAAPVAAVLGTPAQPASDEEVALFRERVEAAIEAATTKEEVKVAWRMCRTLPKDAERERLEQLMVKKAAEVDAAPQEQP